MSLFKNQNDFKNKEILRIKKADKAPPWDLGRGSRDHCKNVHNGSVQCNLQDRIFRFSKIVFFYFILINYANLSEKSDFLL